MSEEWRLAYQQSGTVYVEPEEYQPIPGSTKCCMVRAEREPEDEPELDDDLYPRSF